MIRKKPPLKFSGSLAIFWQKLMNNLTPGNSPNIEVTNAENMADISQGATGVPELIIYDKTNKIKTIMVCNILCL